MGICSSCLGHARQYDQIHDSERSRLLYEDPNHPRYGALHGEAPPLGTQIEPQDLQREEATLRRIVAQTSDNFFDIFAFQRAGTDMAPPSPGVSHETVPAHYQRLLHQLENPLITFRSTVAAVPAPAHHRSPPGTESTWHDEAGDAAVTVPMHVRDVNSSHVGNVVGRFVDLQGAVRSAKASQA